MKNNKNLRGHLAATLCIIVWSITFISTKILLRDFSPAEILFYRFALAFLMLFLMSPKPLLPRFDRREFLYAGAGLCGVTLYFMMQNVGLTYTTASNAGVLVCVAPMFTAIISSLLGSGEKIRKRFLAGFVLSIFGCFLISFNGSFVLSLNPLGDILLLLAALAWAFYCNLLILAEDGTLTLIQRTRKVFFYGLVFLLPVLPFSDFTWGFSRFLEPSLLFNILFLGLVASGVCFLAWNYAVSVLGSVKCAVYIYTNPVVTIFFAALILHEAITWISLLGTVLTLLGLVVSEGKSKASLSEKK
ncbi:MAG: DMT family transporter [Eubacteriales bacterium]|nr:DMT family transporter [Eubacteriales bacterium]MDD3350689.1 DMT family transporter [Eubacteriales bacterium]